MLVGLAQSEGNTTAGALVETVAQLISVPSDFKNVFAEPLVSLAVAPEALPYRMLPREIASNWFISVAELSIAANLVKSACTKPLTPSNNQG